MGLVAVVCRGGVILSANWPSLKVEDCGRFPFLTLLLFAVWPQWTWILEHVVVLAKLLLFVAW